MILCYHGVTKRAERSPRDPDGLHIHVDRFSQQLDHLRGRYQVVPLPEFVKARRANQRLPPYSVVLTFDDGYRNFLTAAAPCLSERKLPATVFLITERMREDDAARSAEWMASDDESCLSWTEARYLLEKYDVEFGSHTRSHRKLSALTPDEGEQEMRDSQTAIRDRLQVNDLALAYPYGDHSSAVAEQARELGYSCALTTEDGANEPAANLYTLRRTLIGNNDDEAAFAIRVSGLISRISRRKRSAKQ